MNKIKICHFIIGFHNGGVEKVIENYFAHMDRTKFDLHIVTHIPPDINRQKTFENMGFQVHQLSPLQGHKIRLKNIEEYRELFSKNKFDIVHNHFPENLLPLFFAKKNKVKCRILHSHNDYQTAFSKKSKLTKILYSLGLKFNISQATHYFACGKKAAESVFGKKNIDKVVLVHNAIDTSVFRFDEKNRIKMREQLGLNDAFVLGHVGRYEANKQKNQEFILEIFQAVLKKIPYARLLMIGEGKTRSEIMKIAETKGILKNIIFTGAVSNVPDYLLAMDVFVFPSLHEGLSVVSIEAQCSGLPLIASDAVSKESAITNLFSSLSLSDSADKWADEVISKMDIIRRDQSDIVKQSGYEICEEAKKLQNMYENMIAEIPS